MKEYLEIILFLAIIVAVLFFIIMGIYGILGNRKRNKLGGQRAATFNTKINSKLQVPNNIQFQISNRFIKQRKEQPLRA